MASIELTYELIAKDAAEPLFIRARAAAEQFTESMRRIQEAGRERPDDPDEHDKRQEG